MNITVVKLSDGKLSVLLDDDEVYILPHKADMSLEELEKCFKVLLREIMDAQCDQCDKLENLETQITLEREAFGW